MESCNESCNKSSRSFPNKKVNKRERIAPPPAPISLLFSTPRNKINKHIFKTNTENNYRDKSIKRFRTQLQMNKWNRGKHTHTKSK